MLSLSTWMTCMDEYQTWDFVYILADILLSESFLHHLTGYELPCGS